MERLEQAEQAIIAAEDVISHERQSRKMISQQLKQKNQELRKLVEGEKKKLQDKVHEELEKTLAQALKEKLRAEQELERTNRVMRERDMLCMELDGMYLTLRDEHRHSEKLNGDQQKIIENLEEELRTVKEERDQHAGLSAERLKTIEKQTADLDEAYGLITKLEEARIVLNKLLGPHGVLTEREREKFLKNSVQHEVEQESNQS